MAEEIDLDELKDFYSKIGQTPSQTQGKSEEDHNLGASPEPKEFGQATDVDRADDLIGLDPGATEFEFKKSRESLSVDELDATLGTLGNTEFSSSDISLRESRPDITLAEPAIGNLAAIEDDLAAIDLSFTADTPMPTLEQQLAQLPEAQLTQDILDGKTDRLNLGDSDVQEAIEVESALERSRPSHSRPSNPNPGRGR